METHPVEETHLEKVNRLERQMIMHSFLYYIYDYAIISDGEFDRRARELAALDRTGSKYEELFKDWTGGSGYHLPHRLSRKDSIRWSRAAHNLMMQHVALTSDE